MDEGGLRSRGNQKIPFPTTFSRVSLPEDACKLRIYKDLELKTHDFQKAAAFLSEATMFALLKEGEKWTNDLKGEKTFSILMTPKGSVSLRIWSPSETRGSWFLCDDWLAFPGRKPPQSN